PRPYDFTASGRRALQRLGYQPLHLFVRELVRSGDLGGPASKDRTIKPSTRAAVGVWPPHWTLFLEGAMGISPPPLCDSQTRPQTGIAPRQASVAGLTSCNRPPCPHPSVNRRDRAPELADWETGVRSWASAAGVEQGVGEDSRFAPAATLRARPIGQSWC